MARIRAWSLTVQHSSIPVASDIGPMRSAAPGPATENGMQRIQGQLVTAESPQTRL